jgi:hypothetical protein
MVTILPARIIPAMMLRIGEIVGSIKNNMIIRAVKP